MSNNNIVENAAGCFDVITASNNQIIRPPPGETLSICGIAEKPCLTIIGGQLEPVLKCYKIRFPNPVPTEAGDEYKLSIKIPRTITGESSEYVIPSDADFSNASGSAFLRGTEKCLKLSEGDGVETVASIECGWVDFELTITLSDGVGDICELEYALCFDKVKLTSNIKKCK